MVTGKHSQPGGVQLLAFCAGGQHFVLDVMRVRELVRAMPLLPTPGAQPWVLGQMVLRSQVLPVLSLQLCLGAAFAKPAALAPPTEVQAITKPEPGEAATEPARGVAWAPHILVIDAAGVRFGLLVERVLEVLRLPAAALLPDRSPAALRSPLVLGLCEIRGLTHMLLDVRPLVPLTTPQT